MLKRLAALEGVATATDYKCVRIIGRTETEARAAYEAEHGPIDPEARIIFRQIVSPSR